MSPGVELVRMDFLSSSPPTHYMESLAQLETHRLPRGLSHQA